MYDITERNARVKKLLQDTYPATKIGVTKGDGTAARWIMIVFHRRVEQPKGMNYPTVEQAIEDLIIGAGIPVSTYPGDGQMPGGKCISIRMPSR
jgi:hypothetical protein